MTRFSPLQEMAADERALRQALAGLEAALKGDLQTIAAFREVRTFWIYTRPSYHPRRVAVQSHCMHGSFDAYTTTSTTTSSLLRACFERWVGSDCQTSSSHGFSSALDAPPPHRSLPWIQFLRMNECKKLHLYSHLYLLQKVVALLHYTEQVVRTFQRTLPS